MQTQILAQYPKANIRVYAIWFNMYPGDARSQWPPELLTDARVVHRWDEDKIVGRWYGQRTVSMQAQFAPNSKWTGEILWDSYLLYGTDARWEDTPTGLMHWGRTIVAARETLRTDAMTLFGTP